MDTVQFGFLLIGFIVMLCMLGTIAANIGEVKMEIRDYRDKADLERERDRYRDALRQIAYRDKSPSQFAEIVLEEERHENSWEAKQ